MYQLVVSKKIDSRIAEAMSKIKIVLYLRATADEVRSLNAIENIDQSTRKQHVELDNVWALQNWAESIKQYPVLNPEKTLDIFKFALALGDPRHPAALIRSCIRARLVIESHTVLTSTTTPSHHVIGHLALCLHTVRTYVSA